MCKLKRLFAAFTATSFLLTTLPQVTVSAFADDTIIMADDSELIDNELADVMLPVTAVGTTAPLKTMSTAAETIIETAAIPLAANDFGTLMYDVRTGTDVVSVDTMGNVTVLKPGTATIAVWAEENDNYLKSEEKIVTINIAKDKVAIITPSNASAVYGTASYANPVVLKSTANPSAALANHSVTYSSSNTNVATINSTTGVITPKNAGTTTITVSSASNTYYDASSATYTFTVTKKSPTLTLSGYSNAYNVGAAAFTLTKSYNGDGSVTYSSSNANVLAVDSTGKVTIRGAGTAKITASASAGTNYSATSVATSAITVNKMSSSDTSSLLTGFSKTIDYNPSSPIVTLGSTGYSASITAPSSGAIAPTGTFSYSIKSGGKNTCGASLSGNTLTYTKYGEVDIIATYSGDSNYVSSNVACNLKVNKIGQTFSSIADITKTLGDPVFSLSGYAVLAQGNGNITYSVISQTPNKTGGNVVTISGTDMSFVGAGTATIEATAAETDQYNSNTTQFTVTVNKATPTFTLNDYSTSYTYGDAPFTINKSYSGDGTITFSSSDPTVLSVDETTGKVTIKKVGTATITATATEGANYVSASVSTSTITVNKAAPTLLLSDYNTAYYVSDPTFTLGTTYTGDGTLSYTSSNSDILTVNSSGTVTFKGVGKAKITVSSTEGANYKSATYTSAEITVNKIPSSITSSLVNGFTQSVEYDASNPKITLGVSPYQAIIDSSPSNGFIPTGTFSYSIKSGGKNTCGASLSGNTLTYTKYGEVDIIATYSGDAYYSSTTVLCSVTVSKAFQTFNAVSDITKTFGDSALSLAGYATLSEGNGAITYSVLSQTPNKSGGNVVSISDNNMSILGAGTAIIKVTASETDQYALATTQFTVTVNKASPTLNLSGFVSAYTYGDSTFTISKSYSGDGTVTFSSSDSSVLSVNSVTGQVTIRKAGTATITASASAGANYKDKIATTGTITVNKAAPDLTVTGYKNAYHVGDPLFTLSTSYSGDGVLTYSSSNEDVLAVNSSGDVIVKKAGKARINIVASEGTNYKGASVSTTEITVDKMTESATSSLLQGFTQTVSYNSSNNSITLGDVGYKASIDTSDVVVMPTGTFSYAIKYGNVNTCDASISSSKLSYAKAGKVEITATYSGDANYSSATVICTLIVNKSSQTFSPIVNLTKTYGDAPYSLTGHAVLSTGDGKITYSVLSQTPNKPNDSVVSITGTSMFILGAGTATIKVTAAETDRYSSVTTQFKVTVNKATPSLSLHNFASVYTYGDNSFDIGVAYSGDGSITFSSSNPNVLSIDANTGTVRIKNAGTAVITATALAGYNYSAKSANTGTITVSKAIPSLTINDYDDTYCVGDSPFSIVISYSGDGEISYSSGDESILEVDSSGKVKVKSAGTTKITVTAAEGKNFKSLSTSTAEITVNKMPESSTASLLSGFTRTINYNPSSPKITLNTSNYKATIATPTTGIAPPTGSFSYIVTSGGTNTCGASISGSILSYTKAGTVDITAVYSGDSNYSSATVACKLTVNKIGQIFNSISDITLDYSVDPYSLAGHATLSLGNGSITYSVVSQSPNKSGGSVVSITNSDMIIKGVGTAVIKATAAETDQFTSKSAQFTVTISKATPNLVLTGYSTSYVFTDASFDIRGTYNGDGIVTFSSSNPAVLSVDKNTGKVTINKTGSATITATATEGDNYVAVNATTPVITVDKATPILSLSGYDSIYHYGDSAFNIIVSYSGDGAITYSSSNPDVLAVSSSGKVTIKKSGKAKIIVSTTAGANYSALSCSTAEIKVDKMLPESVVSFLIPFDRTIVFDPSLMSITLGSSPYSAQIQSSDVLQLPTGTFTYTIKPGSLNTCGASIVDSKLTYTKSGTVNITAVYSGDTNYSSAEVLCTLRILRAEQEFNTVATLTKKYGDKAYDITHHASLSVGNGDLSYEVISQTPNKQGGSVISIANNRMTIIGAGSAIVRVIASETEQFNSASATFTVVIARGTPVITAANITKAYLEEPFSLVGHAHSTSSESPLIYTVSSDVISMTANNYIVSLLKRGTAIVTVSQEQSDNYNAVSTTFSINVNRAIPTFSVAPYSLTFNDADMDITTLFNNVEGFITNSDGVFTISLADTSATDVVSISGATVHILNAGTAIINVSQGLTDRFEATPVLSFELTVNQDQAEVSGTTCYDKVSTDPNFNLDTFTTSTCRISYKSSNPEVATVSQTGEIDVLTAGETTITVTLADDRNYSSTSMTVLIRVVRDTPTLTGSDISLEFISPNVSMIEHMSYNGDGTFSYSGYDTNVLAFENNILQVLHAGNTDVVVTSSETPVWNSVSTTIHVFVDKSHPDPSDASNISCESDPDMDYKIERTFEDPAFDLGFSTRSVGAVSYESSNPYVATISDTGLVTIDHAGDTTITVTVAETADWYEGITQFALKVNKCPVRFYAPSQIDLVCKTSACEVGATWNSDSTYHYVIDNTDVATITQSGMLTAGKFGDTTLTIKLDTNDRYLADSITIPIYVSRADPNLHSEIEIVEQSGSLNKNFGDIDFKLMMTTASDSPIQYSSSDDEIASVNDRGKVHISDIGTVHLTAFVAQTDYYNAEARTYVLNIGKTLPTITGADSNSETIVKYVSDADFKVGISFTNTESVISYSILNPAVASVTEDGYISLLAPGETTIIVSAQETEHYSAYEKRITLIVKPQLLGFTGADSSYISLKMGDKNKQLDVDVDYTNASTIVDIPVHFESLNPEICTVTSDGKITAIGVGKGQIRVSSDEVLPYGANSKLIGVTVSLADLEYSLSSLITVKLGSTLNIMPKIISSGASDVNFTYSVENPDILTVDENGNLTPLAVGDTIVAVLSADTSFYAGISKNIRVSVTKNSPSLLVDSTSVSISMCDKDVPLNVAIDPLSSYGTNLSLSYESLNPDIVTVSDLGEINPISVGQGFIRVKTSPSDTFDTVEITIKITVVREILSYIVDNDVRIAINDTDKSIEPVVLSADHDVDFTYLVHDSSVLNVTEDGVINPIRPGSTLVEITSMDDNIYKGITETVKVTVVKRIPVLQSGSTERINLSLGDPPFMPTFITDDPNDTVELISSDIAIAEVLPDGSVKPTGIGDTEITAILSQPSVDGEPETTEKLIILIPVTVTGTEYGVYGRDSKAINLLTTDKDKPVNLIISSGSVTPVLEYEILNQNVASITPDGRISANSVGSTLLRVTIKAAEQYAEKIIEIPVTVSLASMKYTLPNNISAEYGDSPVSVKPILLESTLVAFTYTSTDSSVATVDTDGNVTFVGVGTAAISVSSDATEMYNGINETVHVVVKKGDPALAVSDIVMLESDDPVKILATAKSEGEITYSTAATDIVTLTDKVAAVAPGIAIVTAKIAETELYRAATTTFTVTVNKNRAYDATMLGFTALSEPAFGSSLDLRITVDQFNEVKSLPFIVYYELEDTRVSLYNGTITALADGKTSTDFTVNLGNLAGDITLYAQIATDYDGFDSMPSDNTLELEITIPSPEFTITINDKLSVVDPSQFIVVPVTVTAYGISNATQIPIQLEFDNSVISTGYINVSTSTKTIVSQLCGYIPANAEDGKHNITARLALGSVLSGFSSSQSVLTDSYEVSLYSPDLGLLLNDLEITPNYTFSYSPSLDSCTVNFRTKTLAESISTLVIDDAVYIVNANETSVDFALSKGKASNLKLTVDSATKSKSMTYYVSIRRMNDSTDAEMSFILEDGTIIKPNIVEGVPVIDIPTNTSGGTLKIETTDPNAKITGVGNSLVDAQSFEEYIAVPTDDDLQIDITIEADDETVRDTLHLIITSINYESYVSVQNASEIAGTVYGSHGIMRGRVFTAYGEEITAVEAAKAAGKTHGLILSLEVSDKNANQYLKGYIEIDGVHYSVHWNSFDGPTVLQAKDITVGYVYVDSSAFTADADISDYPLVVCDYSDSATLSKLSSTSVDVSFGINVFADDFSAYYDEDTKVITLTSAGSDVSFMYRVSKDNGITYSDPVVITNNMITVSETGNLVYEITATDSMQNTKVKTIAVTVKSDAAEVGSGTNVYVSTSRHADYIYVNTSKNNASAINDAVLSIFTENSASTEA